MDEQFVAGFVEAVIAFDNGGLVDLLARHEVVDRDVRVGAGVVGGERGEIISTGVEE